MEVIGDDQESYYILFTPCPRDMAAIQPVCWLIDKGLTIRR